MRRLLLTGSFLGLVVLLYFSWNRRFEPVPGMRTWTLADLHRGVPEVAGCEWRESSDGLRLKLAAHSPPAALRLTMPGVTKVDMLHIHYRLRAHGLVPGSEKWQTGRMLLEWHRSDGVEEMDNVGGIDFDEDSGLVTLVAAPEKGPAVPVLRVEHLGTSGEYELSDLEIILVRERALWKYVCVTLLAGWLAWFYSVIRSWPEIRRRWAFAAAVMWLLMSINFVVPGPWSILKPFGEDFRFAKPASTASGQAPPLVEKELSPEIRPGPVAASGKVPVRGGLPLRVKLLVAQARPLLHVLLLCAPTLVSAWLVGRRPTLFLAILLSCAIEAAQTAFGYGFDWVDIMDLATDGAGIALGLWLAGRYDWSRWLPHRAE